MRRQPLIWPACCLSINHKITNTNPAILFTSFLVFEWLFQPITKQFLFMGTSILWYYSYTPYICSRWHCHLYNMLSKKTMANSPLYLLCLSAHARARDTVVCLCVCVCLCRLLQLLKDESSASKSFYRLLVMFTWILFVDLQNNALFASYA